MGVIMNVGSFKLGPSLRTADHTIAVEAIQRWTRERLTLPEDAPILVSELVCARPDCPPLQTVVAFWTEDGERHHFKILKSLRSIVPDDVPADRGSDLFFSVEGGGGAQCC